MATVYDEQARDVLAQMAKADLDPAKFRDLLTMHFPVWQTSCGEIGFSTATSETALKVSRALHSALPKPFNQRDYLWREMHGFKEVLFYVDWPGRNSGDIATLISDAIKYSSVVLVD